MGWLWAIPIVNGVLGLVLLLFSRSEIQYIKLFTSLLLSVGIWWLIMHFFKVSLGFQNFNEIYLLFNGLSYSLVAIGFDSIYFEPLQDGEIGIGNRIMIPLLLTIFAISAMFLLNQDVTFFVLVLSGLDLFILSFIYGRILVKKHTLLTVLYMIPVAITVMFLFNLSGEVNIVSQEYSKLSLITVQFEHILVMLMAGLYTIAFYRSQYWRKLLFKHV